MKRWMMTHGRVLDAGITITYWEPFWTNGLISVPWSFWEAMADGH